VKEIHCSITPRGERPLSEFVILDRAIGSSRKQRRALVNEVASLIIAGRLHAPIHTTYGITQIKQAVAVAAGGADQARSSSSREADLTTMPRP
jgi:hypothetical protein